MLAGVSTGARTAEMRLAGDPSPNEVLAQEALQQLLSATDAEELHQFVRTWRDPGQALRQSGRLASVRQERDMPHYLTVLQDSYLKSAMLDKLLFPKSLSPLKMPAGMEKTLHDLSLVDGRCTWAFEQIMNMTLPPVIRRNSPEHEQAGLLMFDEFVRFGTRRKAFESLLIKSSIPTSLEEKLALVNDPTTPLMVVDALAHDQQAAVRLAAVQQPYLDIHVLGKLAERDPDDAVREIALSKSRLARRGTDRFLALQKTEAITSVLSRYPITAVFAGQEQPALLPFDLEIEEHLTAMRATWTAAASVATGPQTLAEAVELLVKTLHLPDYPAFCAEGGGAFYCSASTSLEPGADLNAGFAIEHGGTTIYSWHAPHQ